MKSLETLCQLLKQDPTIKRFKTLESIIESNPKFKAQYQDLLAKQKHLVQTKHYQKNGTHAQEEAYKKSLETLVSSVSVNEYLHMQQEVNQIVTMLFNIIESEINALLLDD